MRSAFSSLGVFFPKAFSKPLVAAIVFSSVVHAAIAFTAPDAAPLNDHPETSAASSRDRPLHVKLAQTPSRLDPMSPQAAASPQKSASSPLSPSMIRAVGRMTAGSSVASPDGVQSTRDAVAAGSDQALAPRTDETTDAASRPTPLSYPILVLPPGDDAHRIGMVRLLLVVSSEGKVVQAIVSAATMSQDYIDLVTKSFEDMRFNPGQLRGAPHPGWYEVMVNFDFEPPPATSL